MLPHLLVLGITLYLFLHFAYLQTTINKGWQNIKEDAEIAIQVHRYPNWQNLDELGYPNRSDGTKVTHNTYERIAWATVGSNFIIKYPLGAGMLSRPISLLTQGNLKFATHSGWVELGLAFGVPMLGLIFTALVLLGCIDFYFSGSLLYFSLAIIPLTYFLTYAFLSKRSGILANIFFYTALLYSFVKFFLDFTQD